MVCTVAAAMKEGPAESLEPRFLIPAALRHSCPPIPYSAVSLMEAHGTSCTMAIVSPFPLMPSMYTGGGGVVYISFIVFILL